MEELMEKLGLGNNNKLGKKYPALRRVMIKAKINNMTQLKTILKKHSGQSE
jgi:hypothetical protein